MWEFEKLPKPEEKSSTPKKKVFKRSKNHLFKITVICSQAKVCSKANLSAFEQILLLNKENLKNCLN